MTATERQAPEADADLLRRYAAARSPDAFAALVDRYLPLIYSAAVRQTRDRHLAEDVAQATLLLLAERAGRIDAAVLPGWLLKAVHYAARNALRQRARRVAHEQRAASMRPECEAPAAADDPDEVSRALDPALARLGDADRTAVVLRYFQNKSFAEIAAHLKTTEAAAQRRIARAVEKLRGILARQGVAVSPAALPAALAAQALHPVPPSLAVRATSLAGSKAASTSLIAKGALHAMAAAKVKAAAAIAAAVLLVGVAVPTAYHYATARPTFIPAAPQQQQSPPPPITPLPPLPAGTDMSRPVAGSLPRGITAEPLAMMNLSDKRWIRPTGGEFTNPPAYMEQLLTQLSHLTVPGATHALLFRVTLTARSPISWSYSVSGSNNYGSSGTYDSNTHSSYMVIVFTPSRGANTITLKVNAGDGPWTTNAVIPASATTPTKGSINGVTVTYDPPTEKDGQARIKASMALAPGGMDVAFYAVDSAGQKESYPA